jgi:zinc protease
MTHIPMTKTSMTREYLRPVTLAERFLSACLVLWVITSTSQVLSAADIPDRPEKLVYPPLTYNPPNPADYRVALKSGPVAYVVPDRELPLVTISLYIRTGQYLEPAGKEGVAGMTGYLIARGGTASKSAEDLEEQLAFLAANFGSSVGDDQGSVSMNLLSKDLDEGLGILREALTQPRFQDDKITLYKQQTLQAMKQRNDESAGIEARETSYLAYGENFWANHLPTQASIEGITKEDLQAFHRRWFAPQNFVVAVNGDFDRDAMVAKLEKLFADWPFKGEVPPPVPADPKMAAPGVYLVNKDVNQGRVTMMIPGMTRDDPDFMAMRVMNYILGGGGFTSRLVNRIRSDEGLAYSVRSSVPGGVYFPEPISTSFQSKSPTVGYAMSIVEQEVEKIRDTPVSDEEIDTTKKYFTEVFPRMFSTKGAVAGTFAQDEFTGRYAKQPDFWKTYRDRLNVINKADVQRVAEKWLTKDHLVVVIVGQKDEIEKGHPTHDVSLKSFGPVTDVPLRDPLTLKPMSAPAEAKTN